MEKVLALQKDGSPLLTTEATANKNGWWISYHLNVVLTDEKYSHAENIEKVPEPGMLLMGVNGFVYRVAAVIPRHICFSCGNKGSNRIGHKFYCNDHFKELVVTKPIHKTGKVVNRNDACPCGSGKKYKHCCEVKNQHPARHYFNSEYIRKSNTVS